MSAEPEAKLLLRIPSSRHWQEEAVTLVTQFTISRLLRFERMLREWDGPLSVTIYLTDASDIDALQSYFSDESKLASFRKIALTVVKPDYSINEEALVARLRYPINRLRNLALDLAPTLFVLVTDVDFVPSPNMHTLLHTRGVPLILHPSAPTSSPTLYRTAIAISAFILSPSLSPSYPTTPSLLSSFLSSSPPLAALTDSNAGHGPSLPSLLFHAGPSGLSSLLDWPRKRWSYDVCYEPQWEPYYLLHRASHPLYDERFTDQGGDKQSHALLLNALGFDFKILRDVWFMHPPKGEPGEDEWPSARLADPGEEGREMDDPTHFSNGQRDETRWRYFEDFLPELERRWGANVRWPRGCSARVVGGRSFGRAKAGTIFGM